MRTSIILKFSNTINKSSRYILNLKSNKMKHTSGFTDINI